MSPVFVFFISVCLIAMISFLMNKAKAFLSALIVCFAGQLAVMLMVVPEAREEILLRGTMGPIATLTGVWVVSVICGVCLAELVFGWAHKKSES